MSSKWTLSSNCLPYAGESIDFLLEDRPNPIHGTFLEGSFHSRWAHYDVNRVQSWRHASHDTAHELIGPPEADKDQESPNPVFRVARRLLFKSGGSSSQANSQSQATHVRPESTASSNLASERSNGNHMPS